MGNCTEASIASILEVELSEVPSLWTPELGRTDERWFLLTDWLRSQGYLWCWGEFPARELPTPIEAVLPEWDTSWLRQLDWAGYHLLAGPNPDGVPHMVVARGGVVVWDPNPLRRGITRADGIGMLVPLKATPDDVREWPGIKFTFDQ